MRPCPGSRGRTSRRARRSRTGGEARGSSRAVRSARRRQWRSSSKTRSLAVAASNRLIGLCCEASRGPAREGLEAEDAAPCWRSTMGWKTVVIWFRRAARPAGGSGSGSPPAPCLMRTLSHASLTSRGTTRSAMMSGLWKATAKPTVTLRRPRRYGEARPVSLRLSCSSTREAIVVEVGDPRAVVPLPAAGREEEQEGVAPALVEGQQVGVARTSVPVQLADESGHGRRAPARTRASRSRARPAASSEASTRTRARWPCSRSWSVSAVEPLVVGRDLGVQGLSNRLRAPPVAAIIAGGGRRPRPPRAPRTRADGDREGDPQGRLGQEAESRASGSGGIGGKPGGGRS